MRIKKGKSISYQAERGDASTLIAVLLMTILVLLFSLLGVRAIDGHIENQDRILCNSALKSGNKEWLEKCQCFYEAEDITCLQEEPEKEEYTAEELKRIEDIVKNQPWKPEWAAKDD